ncbi:MAG: HEPN domain-containing protein [Crenarchaeota archaeon]|nr:HEPN domain-containing protein [Thermoproteota archaeon]
MDSEEFSRWMSQAEKTFELIDADIEYQGYSWACFKAQQAAEFAVKALLYLLGKPAFGHEVSKLIKKAGLRPPEEVAECAVLLDRMYIPPRYPDAFSEGSPWEFFTKRDALEAKECARRIIEWVREVARDIEREGGAEEEGN